MESLCNRSKGWFDFSAALRLPVAAIAVAALSGCALTQTSTTSNAAGVADGLYAGEPAALHATEMPVASAEEARARAQVALAERDVDLALYLLVQAVNMDPADAGSLYTIGAIHQQRGNDDLAARAFAEATALEPDNALAYQGLGLAYFNSRQFAEAEAPLLKAVELDATLWRAHNALGILADRDESYDLAVSHYTLAIEAQPNLASIRNNRGYSRYLSGDLEAAKRDFLAAIEIDPAFELAWQNVGLVYAREKNYDRAVQSMIRAMPRHVALNDVGYIAMLDGNYALAQAYFEDAIIASPRHYQVAQENLDELRRRTSSNLLVSERN